MNSKITLYNDEQQLLSAIGKGDEDAFRHIYNQYYKSLCLYSDKFLNDLSVSEDIVQDCIFTLWEQRANLSHISKIKSYLFKSVHNKCLNYINHLKVQGKFKTEAAYQLKLIELEQTDSLILQERSKKIADVINKLPEKSRICFEMKRIDGLSQKEIASKLNITEKAVEANISRALKSLRIDLKDYLIVSCLVCLFSVVRHIIF